MNNTETSKTGSNDFPSISKDPNVVDFVSIPIRRIDWEGCEQSNLAGLYINQAMFNTEGFAKVFVGEIDIFSQYKQRITARLSKEEVRKLIKALIELEKNL